MITDEEKPWFDQPCFQRYWRHYGQTFDWYKHHTNVWNDSNVSSIASPSYPIPMRSNYQENNGLTPKFIETASEELNSYNEDNESNSSEEMLEMEITEELIEFFEQSETHRKELKIRREERYKKKREDEKKASMKPASSWSHSENCALPSHVSSNSKRTAEMKFLYGKSAAKIHGMETAVQLAFDRYCDLHQPKLWPVIPLNL